MGDVAGMGADLYSSFVGSIVASSVLGFRQFGNVGIALPFWIAMSGIVCAVLGMCTIRCKEGATQTDLLNVLRRGMFVAAFFELGKYYFLFVCVLLFLLVTMQIICSLSELENIVRLNFCRGFLFVSLLSFLL